MAITSYRAMVIMESLTEAEWNFYRDQTQRLWEASEMQGRRPGLSLTPSEVGFVVAEEVERQLRQDS